MSEGSSAGAAAPRRLIIIDGYSLLYRAFFATRYLSTSDGRPTNALFGFTTMLFILLENHKPDAIVVALDGGSTFRHELSPDYKATRNETAEELRVQLVEARNLIAALGIPQIEAENYEADDVVGTLARLAEANGYHTSVVTGDLDALQLVDECVSVITPKSGVSETVTYDPDAVRARFGFAPQYIPDFKAIKGETSDNIAGVPGIGEKGATELIAAFGTVENMIIHFDELPLKFQKRMTGLFDQMLLSKQLATIVRDVPLEYDFRRFAVTAEQVAAAQHFIESFEFTRHARNVERVLRPFLITEGGEGAIAPADLLPSEEAYAFSTSEVRSEAMLMPRLRGKSFAVYLPTVLPTDLFDEGPRTALIAVGEEVLTVPEPLAYEALVQMGANATVHDSKAMIRRPGGRMFTPAFDTMLAGYVLDSGRTGYGLRDLIGGYTPLALPTTPEELAAGLLRLAPIMAARLEKESQTAVLKEIEMPVAPILAEMEARGICVDPERLESFSQELQTRIEELQTEIYGLAGREFLIGSTKQLGTVLFEEMNLPQEKRTGTGAYATGSEVLAPLAPDYPIAGLVLEYRELTKLKTTYADALGRLIAPDGRIHTTYNQTVAATGRLSSESPNLQNIPIRTELGRSIRRAFVAGEGYELLSLDYSQIELRILAHMCGEPALVAAFERGEDIHEATARAMFEDAGATPKEHRRLAKMLNYAVLYGVTDFGLANQLGIGFGRKQARDLIARYAERFPLVKEFTKSVVLEARSKGFTTTLAGRRRHFPDIHAAKVQDRQYAERQAMNAPIQGTAADMIKLAMVRLAPLLSGSETYLLLNVHDELVFEIPEGDRSLVEPIRRVMETALPLNVPVEVDAKVGSDWSEMVKLPRA